MIGRVVLLLKYKLFNWEFCQVSLSRLRPYKVKGTDVWAHGACPQSLIISYMHDEFLYVRFC